ncbi:MAG: phospholipase D-like domain-containing protein [Syntrophales bacterium]
MKRRTMVVLFLLPLLLIGLAAISCGRSDSADGAAARTLIIEPADGKAAVLAALNAAAGSIRLTIYQVDDAEILAALRDAAARGVAVTILYNYYSFPTGKREEVSRVMATLEGFGILTRRAAQRFTVTHQKTFVIDDREAIIMTFNLQADYFVGTRDFGVITTDAAEVAEIRAVFDADWNEQPAAPSLAELIWSPENSRAKILALIRSARVSLDVYNEEAADPECLEALAAAAADGVTVRFITAVLGADEAHDQNRPGRDFLNQRGVKAHYADFLYIHAKMILIDYGTANARAFLGSENFSSTSLDKNRELGILVAEPEIADALHAAFEADWIRSKTDS